MPGMILQGHALNQYQAGSFLAPITYAANTVEGNLKLLQQNKIYFLRKIYHWIIIMMQL